MLSARRAVPLIVVALAYAWPVTGQCQSGGGVRDVSFSGNKAIDSRTLSTSIATTGFRRPFFLRWLGNGTAPAFNEREFRRDVLRLKALYGVRGFPEATVDTTVVRKGKDVYVTFLIREGSPIKVDSVQVTGLPGKEDADAYRKGLPLQGGEPFDRVLFATSTTTIEARLHNEGYPFAKVTGGFRAAPDAQSVVAQLDAVPGPRAVIGRIDVRGNERIDKRVILKTLSIYPGQVYSYKAMHQSQIDLYRSEMFRQVQISIEDSVAHDPTDTLVNVAATVQLAEYPLQRARLSAGYGTLDCFRGLGSMDLFNFTGGGRRLELRAGASKIGVAAPFNANLQDGVCPALASEDSSRLKLNYNLSIALREPLLFSRKATATVSVFTERHTEYHAYLREAIGTDVAVTRTLSEDMLLRVGYSLSKGRTTASAVTFCALLNVCNAEDTHLFSEPRLRSALSFGIARDRTNSVLDATRGTALAFDVRWSPAFLGSDSLTQFTRLLFTFEAHREVGVKNVLSTRFELGTIFARTVQFAAGPVDYAPPEERFYLGGANTVRGYAANQLGPVVRVLPTEGDPIISAIGGNFMALGSVEARFAIPGPIRGLTGAVFVDAGEVAYRSTASLSNIKVTPGVGLRVSSPLGPIRLDAGFNPYPIAAAQLYQQNGEDLTLIDPNYQPVKVWYDYVRFNFSIGQAF